MLIDHGRLAWKLESPHWKAEIAQNPMESYANRLSEILWGHTPSRAEISSIMIRGQNHRDKLDAVWPELERWAALLVPDSADQKAWTTFLQERVQRVEALISQRYNLLT